MAEYRQIWMAEDGSEHPTKAQAEAHENCSKFSEEVMAYARENFKFKIESRYEAKARELMKFWVFMEGYLNEPDDEQVDAEPLNQSNTQPSELPDEMPSPEGEQQ